jgi:26S proteasome regulatory subunit N12
MCGASTLRNRGLGLLNSTRQGQEGERPNKARTDTHAPCDPRHLLPPSQGEHHLTGLNLLRLLVQNRTAEFHTELEVLTPDALASAPVRYAVTLEQSLMEGAYNKVLSSAAAPHDATSGWLTQRLAQTVRDEVAACAAAAYDTLPLATAQNLLRLDSAAATTAFCAQARLPCLFALESSPV